MVLDSYFLLIVGKTILFRMMPKKFEKRKLSKGGKKDDSKKRENVINEVSRIRSNSTDFRSNLAYAAPEETNRFGKTILVL